MSENLTDPNKAAHEIIATLSGKATRNDKVVLHAADTNPWYVLATIYGEQQKMAMPWLYNNELAKKNRRAWNGWFCQKLTDEQISKLVKDFNLNEADVSRLTGVELKEIEYKFSRRMGPDSKLPIRHYALIDETEPEIGEVWEAEYFNRLLFDRPINFDGFLFDDEVAFDYSVFKEPASFSKALFFAGASFDNTHFADRADFSKCEFVKDPQLKTENARASFIQATFSDEANFGRAKFGGKAAFRFTQFSRKARFTKAEFKNYAAFRSSVFSEDALFRGVQFGGFANFASASFKSVTRFDDASFHESVPEFYGANIFENATFPCSSGNEGNWPQLSGKTTELVGQQKRAYNRLRLFMNRSLQIDEEQFFHRQEMRCKREMAVGVHKWIYWAFEKISDYGISVKGPVVGLAASIVIGAAVLMLYLGMDGRVADGSVFWESLGWSVSNSVPFLGYGKLYYGADYVECFHWGIKAIAGVQTFAGYVLLFLLGLGLRNRFRLR